MCSYQFEWNVSINKVFLKNFFGFWQSVVFQLKVKQKFIELKYQKDWNLDRKWFYKSEGFFRFIMNRTRRKIGHFDVFWGFVTISHLFAVMWGHFNGWKTGVLRQVLSHDEQIEQKNRKWTFGSVQLLVENHLVDSVIRSVILMWNRCKWYLILNVLCYFLAEIPNLLMLDVVNIKQAKIENFLHKIFFLEVKSMSHHLWCSNNDRLHYKDMKTMVSKCGIHHPNSIGFYALPGNKQYDRRISMRFHS